MNKPIRIIYLLVLFFCLMIPHSHAKGDTPVVRAVLFFSPTCPACHQVITEDLPPILDQYQDQLQIIGIDTSVQEGSLMYQAAITHFQIPEHRRGVPALIIGETVLIGAQEIPEQLPGIIESGLASGGIDWPDIPGFRDLIEAAESQGSQDNAPNPTTDDLSLSERFGRDLSGNIMAVIVLAGMLFSIGLVGFTIINPESERTGRWPSWVIPVLAIIGFIVAAYLSYVEFTQSEAICGPVGDCNTVQQSPYAKLFDILPIGVLGMFGYLLIGISWLIQQYTAVMWRYYAAIIIWILAGFGTAFSIYLTFLEPFVIGATCAWCITSSILMTVILLSATYPALHAWSKIGFAARKSRNK
jgi:uncharacterized membrane protein